MASRHWLKLESPETVSRLLHHVRESLGVAIDVDDLYHFTSHRPFILKEEIHGDGSVSGNGQSSTERQYETVDRFRELIITRLQRCGPGTEFAHNFTFDADVIDIVCQSGVFPMASPCYRNVVEFSMKLHTRRCVMDDVSSQLHVSKSTRKRAKKYLISVNKAAKAVLEGIWNQHGFNWMYPVLAVEYLKMHENTLSGGSRYRTDVFSIEVWQFVQHDSSNDVQEEKKVSLRLVAGELGYAVGKVYTSLTGFYSNGGEGSVQLCALGRMLSQCGFAMWDLGMGGSGMKYKTELGAHMLKREDFLKCFDRCSRVAPLWKEQEEKEQEQEQEGEKKEEKPRSRRVPRLQLPDRARRMLVRGLWNGRDVIDGQYNSDIEGEQEQDVQQRQQPQEKKNTQKHIKKKSKRMDDSQGPGAIS